MSFNRDGLDLYAVLSVTPASTFADIRTAYKKAALQAHPDKGGSDECFRRVMFAFETLSQEAARAAYDKRRQRVLQPSRVCTNPKKNKFNGRENQERRREFETVFPEARRAAYDKRRRCPLQPSRVCTKHKKGKLNQPEDQERRDDKRAFASTQSFGLRRALERLRKVLQSMCAEQRHAVIPRLHLEVRKRLVEFMSSTTADAKQEQSEIMRVVADDDDADGTDMSESSCAKSGDVDIPCLIGHTPTLAIEDAIVLEDWAKKTKGKRFRMTTRGVMYSGSLSRAQIMIANVRFYTKLQPDVSAAINHHVTLANVRRAVTIKLQSGGISEEDFRHIIVDAFASSSTPVDEVGLRGTAEISIGKVSGRVPGVAVRSAALPWEDAVAWRSRFLTARCVGWDAFRAAWIDCLQHPAHVKRMRHSEEQAIAFVDGMWLRLQPIWERWEKQRLARESKPTASARAEARAERHRRKAAKLEQKAARCADRVRRLLDSRRTQRTRRRAEPKGE